MKQLFKHQKEGIEFALKNNGRCALYWDMGMGKSIAALKIYERLRQSSAKDLRLLVIAPLSLLEAAWGDEIKPFGFSYFNCHEEGFGLIDPRAWIVLVNYESLIQKKNLEAIVRHVRSDCEWMCVVDESSRMKNHSSKTARTLLAMRNLFKYRIVMSGTPAPNSELEYWAQMEFVRPGVLHESFFGFRNTFFHMQNKYTGKVQTGQFMTRYQAQEMFRTGWGYEITDARRSELMARIAPYCHRRRKEECLDLPDEMDEVRHVELGAKQAKAYGELRRALITEISGEHVVAAVALAKLMKLREIISGFALTSDGKALEIGESAKMKELEAIVDELGSAQAIIWCEFQWEIRQIQAFLGKIGRTWSALWSGADDKEEAIKSFKSGASQFLVAHPRSAAHGLTFVNASTEVFFSLSYSFEAYEQARARIHRIGQKNACTYIHLIAKDTVDEAIYKVLKRKGREQDILYEFLGKNELRKKLETV